MAVFVIDNAQLHRALGKEGERMREETPRLYEIVSSLAGYLRAEFQKKENRSPKDEELELKARAYFYDKESSWEEVRELMVANGDARRGVCQKREDLPLPRLGDLLAHINRCKGNISDEKRDEAAFHQLGCLFLCESGLPKSEEELKMREEMMAIFDDRAGDPNMRVTCMKAEEVAERHMAVIYSDEKKPLIGDLNSEGRISWMPLGNGSEQEAETYVHTLIEAMRLEHYNIKIASELRSWIVRYNKRLKNWEGDPEVKKRLILGREMAREGWRTLGLV